MSRALPIQALILILVVLVALERAITVALHKRRRPARARTLPQQAIAITGFVALAVPISLLQLRFGLFWTLDLVLLACGTWSIIFSVVLFGLPEPAGPDRPPAKLPRPF
jgi:hypothetical protein